MRAIFFRRKKDPATVELDIDVELLESVVLLDICTMDSDHVADAFNLRAVFRPLGVDNAVHKLVIIFGFVPARMVAGINNFDCADVLVVGLLRLAGVHHNAVDVHLVLISLQFSQVHVDHLDS